MTALFTVTRSEQGSIQVHSDCINWTFTFDLDGCMVDGFELAATLADEGQALADWAVSAQVGDTERFDLAEQCG
jgi:hypothetical protein